MNSDKAKLYYETHVTIEPVYGDRQLVLRSIAARHGYSVADLLMQKNRQPTDERSDKDMFCTGHGIYRFLTENTLKAFIKDLQEAGFRVWRYKIEDTVMDSRRWDELQLLKGQKDDGGETANS